MSLILRCEVEEGEIQEQAKQDDQDQDFTKKMQAIFTGEPHGYLIVPTLQRAFERIAALEARVIELEHRILRLESSDRG